MSRVEDRLKGLTGGFPEQPIDGHAAMPAVVRKGRVRRTVARGVTGIATSLALVTGALAAPGLLDGGPQEPVILGEVDGGEREGLTEEERAEKARREAERERVRADREKAEERRQETRDRIDAALAEDALLRRDRVTDRAPAESDAPKTDAAPVKDTEPTSDAKPDATPVKDTKPDVKPDPKPTKEPLPPEADWRFSANQRASVVEGDPPVNVYWGTGKPGTDVKVWSEFGHVFTDVDREGNWETRLAFTEAPAGRKTFRVTVFHKATDHQKAFELTTVRPERPADWRFTANQRNEIVEGDPPVNVYWGTGKPGTQVKVWSDYGHVYTDVDREGHWETRLAFTEAPAGRKTFRVTVFHKATDHQKAFELTTVRPEREADWRFTANQRDSVVEGDPPVNVYWGTGKPGTQVKVYSDYGWIYTDVDRNGDWETRLAFADAPAGRKTFRVTVFHKATDHQKAFELTTVRPEKDRPAEVDFTVAWVFESCDEDLPYQDASGTAAPNSEVLLWSEYGQKTVRADSEGRWSGRVHFPEAPRGERAVFDIKARSQATGEAIWQRGFVTERPA